MFGRGREATARNRHRRLYHALSKIMQNIVFIHDGETRSKTNLRVAEQYSARVLIDIETDAEFVHRSAERKGEDYCIVRPVQTDETKGSLRHFRVLSCHFLTRNPFAKFHRHIVEAGAMDLDLLYEITNLGHPPQRVSFKLFNSIFNGLRRLFSFRKEPYHKFFGRIVVKGFVFEKVTGAAVRAFPYEKGTVQNPGLELGILGGRDAWIRLGGVMGTAITADDGHHR